MGPAGRPPALVVAVRWPAGQSESWREPARQHGPGITACPAGRISPAARPAPSPAARPAGAGIPRDGQERERTRSHRSRRTTPGTQGHPPGRPAGTSHPAGP
jgi:hypothetical protein